MINRFTLLQIFVLLAFLNISAQNVQVDREDKASQKTLNFNTATTEKDAILEFTNLYDLNDSNTFIGLRKYTDQSGKSHQRFQQYCNGVKVEYGMLIVHSKNNVVESINGELYNADKINLIPTITKNNGLLKAINAVGAQKYVWEDTKEAEANSYVKPEGDVVIYSNINTNDVKLAIKYDVFALNPVSREHIYIDAQNGKVLFRNQIIKHANGHNHKGTPTTLPNKIEDFISSELKENMVSSSADTKYSGTKSIETAFDSTLGSWTLNDLTRGNGIVTYNSQVTNTMPSTHFTDADNIWSAAEFDNANFDNVALDAHWGAEKTYDFWKNTYNRNSFDDNNAQIRSYVHFTTTTGSNWSNAQWTGSVMRYGDGGGSFTPLTSIDVLAHEIGHAICQYTADLVYANQSGGMNEGFSDIWGACVEQYAKFGNLNAAQDTSNPGSLGVWKIGEEFDTSGNGGLRSMSYPLTKGDPDTFKGTNYITTADDGNCAASGTNDQCGVHSNSGVLNHWFYILTAGKAGTNNATIIANRDVYNVVGIGMAKASQIAYLAERDYLTPNATFQDARLATITVAKNLFGIGSTEYAAVMDSWNAVNVGSKFNVLDVIVKSAIGTSTVACGAAYSAAFTIENQAGPSVPVTTTLSYKIDGGAAIPVVWNGAALTTFTTQSYPITISGLSLGTHVITVTATLTGDGDTTNNTKSTVVTVNQTGIVNTLNNFNTPTDVLVSVDASGQTNNLWQRGTLAATKTKLTNTIAGSQVYATKLSGKYPDKTTAYLVSQCYDLTSMINTAVTFDMAFDLESNWDIIFMEYSTNGGNTWDVLGTSTSPNWYNSSRLPNGTDCFNCIGKQWTGDFATAPSGGNGVNGNKRNYSHSLAPFSKNGATPSSNFLLRFKFVSDDAENLEGVFVDNFVVTGTLSTADNAFENFAVYPNPSNGKINITLSTSDKVTISLYDLRGRNVFNNSYLNENLVFNKEIDFKTLTSGIYMLNVESDGKKATKKIIVN